MLNIIGNRYKFFAFSLAIIIPGIIIMAVWGIPFSIDFLGGSRLEVQFTSGQVPETAKIYQLYQSLGVADAQVVTSGTDIVEIVSSTVEDDFNTKVLAEMKKLTTGDVITRRAESVGPTIGQEVTRNALLTLAITCIALVAFISWSFRGLQNAFFYGIATVVALIHDVLIILSILAIGGRIWGWQVDTLFLTALLTVIAFSAQDTIVVFDRMRENSNIFRKLDYETLVNHSIVQTLSRSINTQLMTVDFMLLATALFGGVTLRGFATVLLVGMISGSYSSIFIAAPFLVIWEKREWKTWFRRKSTTPAA
jgi:preprotein translocase subunit SecF